MDDMPTSEEQLWAYLQRELSDEDRATLEAALEKDPALLESLKAMTGADQALRDLLPAAEFDDKRIDDLIKDFDAEHAASEETETPAPKRKTIQFPFWAKSLSVAALISIIFIYGGLLPGGSSLEWASPQIIGVLTRGGEPPASTVYDDDSLTQWLQTLQDTVSRNYDKAAKKDAVWTFSTTLQPGLDDLLLINIEAVDQDGSRQLWNFTAQSPDHLEQQTSLWAEEISTDLTTRTSISD